MVEWLDKACILQGFSSQIKNQISAIELFPTLPSTNTYLLKESKISGHVCLAEQQSAGRGRRGKKWISPLGNNIYLSLRWHFSLDTQALSGLSLVVGLAVIKALQHYGASGLALKWPNDVLSNHKKIAGILVEFGESQEKSTPAVIGIGINGDLSFEQGKSIEQPWTSLAVLCGKPVKRNALVSLLLEALLTQLASFEEFGFACFQKEWEKWDVLVDKNITLLLANSRLVHGIARGVDFQGALIVETEGKRQAYFGGEVSGKRILIENRKAVHPLPENARGF